MTVWTGIRIRNYFGTFRNCLQDLAIRQLWSKLRLVPLLQELFKLAVATSSTRICFSSDFTAVQNFDLKDAFG